MELVLNTYGVSLNCDNNAFMVSNADGRQRIPVEGITAIHICKGAQVTSDAIMLAIENEIEVVFSAKSGDPVGRVWSPKYGSISTIRKGQLAFTFSSDAVAWIKGVIMDKIEHQQALILTMDTCDGKYDDVVKKAVRRLEDYRTKIKSLSGDIVADIAPTLRGWEGVASKIYFEAINVFLPEEYRFDARSQRPATDIANAMLNYGYGLLYGKIEGALIKAGIDPYVGVMHRDDYNRPVLAFDVIEIYRVWIDYVVFTILMQHKVTDEFYSVKPDGSCWLEGLGRRVLIQSVNDYMEDVVEIKGLRRSRLTQIQLYAQNLAQTFKKYC